MFYIIKYSHVLLIKRVRAKRVWFSWLEYRGNMITEEMASQAKCCRQSNHCDVIKPSIRGLILICPLNDHFSGIRSLMAFDPNFRCAAR